MKHGSGSFRAQVCRSCAKRRRENPPPPRSADDEPRGSRRPDPPRRAEALGRGRGPRVVREVGALDLAGLVDLEDVALAQVVEAVEEDAALEALGHLAHVVLEAPELRDRRLVNDGPVADDPNPRATTHDAARDVAAGDRAEPRDAEELPDLGLAERFLVLDRPQHA